MAKIMNDNFQINVGNPIDSKYLNSSNQPYTGVTAVNTAIVQSQRYRGLTVNVNSVEYWYYLGVTDGDLVIKDSGIAETGITTAINGLTKVSNAVRLGGTLTGSTVITDSRGTPIGIQYGGDYSPNFTLESLATWRSVATVRPTGETTGFTLSLPMLGEAVIVTSVSPVTVTIPLNSSVAFPIGSVITIQQGGAGTVTAVGASGVTVNGVVLSTTKQYAFVQYWKTATNVWSVIGGAIEIWQTSGSSLIVPVDSNKRVPVQFISGLTTALGEFVSGATNGLTKVGQTIVLGGALTGDTTICGSGSGTYTLALGSYIDKLDKLTVDAKCVTIATSNGTNIVQLLNNGTMSVTDAVCSKGLVYTNNYNANFGNCSLVDKEYVDNRVCCYTSGVTCAITSANNGLTKVGQNVVLGGALTGDTTIGTGLCGLAICSNSFFNVQVGSAGCDSYLNVCSGTSFLNTVDSNIPRCGEFYTTKDCAEMAAVCNGYATSIDAEMTKVCIGSSDSAFCGAVYGADYSANFVDRSIPDAAWVTGKTKHITNIASVGQIIYRDSTQLTGSSNMIYCETCESVSMGLNNTASGANSGVFAGESNTASASDSGVFAGETNVVNAACSVILGGNNNTIASGNVRAAIIGSQNINLTGTTYIDIVAVDCLAVMNAIGCTCNLLCVDSITGIVGYTSLSVFGGITGGTNGIVNCGSQNLGLGGALCASTTIDGDGKSLSLGGASSKLDNFNLNASGTTTMCTGALVVTSTSMALSSSGATYTDLNASSFCPRGIRYAADYSLKYDVRTLVDKGYVDSVATGLNIHAAVDVATTVPILLSGTSQTIDGVPVTSIISVNNRILVKNQVSGATNGIYSASTGVWGRTADYQTNVQITNGDLIPVTSGSTQNSSIWALITPEPITVGVTSLDYTEFSTVVDVQAGQGIAITQVGGAHTVCVLLPGGGGSACGLAVSNSGLCIDSGIGGNGLTYTAGVINANACNCGSVPAIPVGYDGSDNLVVACSDIKTAVNALTGATNGLYCSAHVVKLGCALTEATTICGANTYGLAITGLTTFNLGFGAGDVAGIVKDSNTNPRGLQYYGDYSATFCDNSLITKKFLTDCTACSSAISLKAITGVTNGLTKYACHDACLGGVLATNLIFTNATSGTYGVCFGTGNSCRIDNFLVYSDNIVGLLSQTRLVIGNADSGGTGGIQSLSFCGASGMVVRDDCQSKGLVYAGNYDANFTQYSLVDAQYVTGKTSQAILTAGNGLTKSGTKVILGGSLTGNTDIYNIANTYLGLGWCAPAGGGANGARVIICNGTADPNKCVNISSKASSTCTELNVATTGLTITSSAVGFLGAVYGGDYECNFVPRSLVTAQYVCGLITGGTGISCANNGLTKVGNTVVLGGYLTGATCIDLCQNDLCFVHTNIATLCEIFFKMDTVVNNICLGAKITGGTPSFLVIDPYQFKADTAGAATFQGFTYCNGFATAVGDIRSCSIPDVAFVTGLTSCGITTANNGLSYAGQNVTLGGSLTGDTCISGAYVFGVDVSTINLTGSTAVNLTYGTGTITHVGGTTGLVYAGNYGATNVALSIPDAQWVTGCTSAVLALAITGGTNGLSVDGACSQRLVLGGCLCCTTIINVLSNSFAICGAPGLPFLEVCDGSDTYGTGHHVYLMGCCQTNIGSPNSKCLTFGFCESGIITDSTATPLGLQYASDAYRANFTDCSLVDKKYVCSQVSGITACAIISANNGLSYAGQNITLGGDLTGNTVIGNGSFTFGVNTSVINLTGSTIVLSGTTYIGVPAEGSTSDSVLVRVGGTGEIRTVAGSSLGDKNNIYAKTVVSVSTGLTTGSTYVILVSPSSGTTITLPSTPIDGQVFKLKDISGNALTFNIVVDAGAGKQIDNNQCALINTDYGALEIMYESAAGKWYSLSFVN